MIEPNVIYAVAGILKRDDKILVAERPPGKAYSEYWEFPGGKIEANESGFEALKRELREELGIDVITAKLLHQLSHRYPDKEVFLEIWLVTEFSGNPEAKENQLLQWVTLEEMRKLRLLEGNWAVLDFLVSIPLAIERN